MFYFLIKILKVPASLILKASEIYSFLTNRKNYNNEIENKYMLRELRKKDLHYIALVYLGGQLQNKLN